MSLSFLRCKMQLTSELATEDCGRNYLKSSCFSHVPGKNKLFFQLFILYWGIVVHSLSRVWLFANPWTAAHHTFLPFTISQSLLKLMPIESVMPSNHLTLCCPLLLPSVFPSIRVLYLLPIIYASLWFPQTQLSINMITFSFSLLRVIFEA